jgi:hypothetical protein
MSTLAINNTPKRNKNYRHGKPSATKIAHKQLKFKGKDWGLSGGIAQLMTL